MNFQYLLYKLEDGIATIIINRPDKLNAFTPAMADDLIAVLDHIDEDDNVKAVVITGAGRAFCAGADLSSGKDTFNGEGGGESAVRAGDTLDYSDESVRDIGGLVTLRLYRCLKPIIAAINGPAVGVGITMTLAMDIRLASENAKVGFVFARRGIAPEAASSFFLPRIVGISRALEWCFSGSVYPISEIKDSGLIRKVCSEQELLPEAYAIAREIVDNTAPVSVALIRQMLWRGLDMNHPMDAHKLDSRAILSRGRSSDAAEGVVSFIEKRPPEFKNQVSKDMPDFYPWWDEPKYL
jgi:enoyl-CoA hydratase/carnithine racemase